MSRSILRQTIAVMVVTLLAQGESLAQRGSGGQSRGAARSSVHANRDVNVNQNVNRNTNVNRDINIDRDIDIDVDNHYRGGYGYGCCYHPVTAAAAVTTAAVVTAAAIGSIVQTLPPSCGLVVVNGISYQQCGSTWYQPQFSGSSVNYVVIAPPR